MNELRKFINKEFKDFPSHNEEVKLLKEELYSSLRSKYESLIRDGKSEKDAYHDAIKLFGDIEELKSEYAVEHNKNKKFKLYSIAYIGALLFFYFTTFILKAIVLGEPLSELNIYIHMGFIVILITGMSVISRITLHDEKEWLWVVLLLGLLSLLTPGVAIILIMISSYGIIKYKLWNISRISIANLIVLTSFLVAFYINFSNIIIIEDQFENPYLLLINGLCIATFILNLYLLRSVFKLKLNNQINFNNCLGYGILVLNIFTWVIIIKEWNYFALITLGINLYLLKSIQGNKKTFSAIVNKKNRSLVILIPIISILLLLGTHIKTNYLLMPYELNDRNVTGLTWRTLHYPVSVEIIDHHNYMYDHYQIRNAEMIRELIISLESKGNAEPVNVALNNDKSSYRYKVTIMSRPNNKYENHKYYFTVYEHQMYMVNEDDKIYLVSDELLSYIEKLVEETELRRRIF